MSQLAPRERWLLGLALVVVLVAVLWWQGIAPALATLRDAPARHAALDDQLRVMRTLAREAAQLSALPRPDPTGAQRALEQSVRETLGASASLVLADGRATLTLNKTGAQALAQWLAQARANARVLPGEAHLTRVGDPAGAPLWDGVLVLTLPRQP